MKREALIALLVGIFITALLIGLSFVNDGFIGLAVASFLLLLYSLGIYFDKIKP